ncbi:MAG: J domain-containing protein [Nitrospinota bacterium]
MNHSFDPYNVLGIDKNASLHEIKFAYFKKVKESPPEVDPINFKRIRQAYESHNDER